MSESEIAGYLHYQLPSPSKQQKKLPFYRGINRIGRDVSNVLCIPHLSVSSFHGILTSAGTKLFIQDKSKNGIKLNSDNQENKLKKQKQIQIFDGTVLYMGEVKCKIELVPHKPDNEETLIIPTKTKIENKNVNLLKMIYSSQDDINVQNKPEIKEEIKNRQELPSKQESDEFSLTGDFYDVGKKDKNQKKDKKEEISTRDDKKEAQDDTKKNEELAKNKKKDTKKPQLEKKKEQKQVDDTSKDQKKSSKDKKALKDTSKEGKNEKVADKKTKTSKQKQDLKKKEKQEQLKKEKQQKKKKEQQQQRLKKQKQQKQKKQKQQLERKQRQQKQKRQVEQKAKNQKSKTTNLRKAFKEQKSLTQLQTSEEVQNKKNMRKSNVISRKKQAQPAEDTKRRTSHRKRLPSEPQVEDQNYPLRRSFMNKRILISGFIPNLTKKYFCIVDAIEDEFDYLVMKDYKRTFKALYAVCKGIYILRYDWIKESQFLEKTLRPENYHFKDIDYVYDSILKTSRGYKVFAGLQFYLGSDQYHLTMAEIEALIYAGGGELMKKIGKLTAKQKEGKDKIAIIRNPDEKNSNLYEQEVKRVKKLGFDEVHKIQLILDSCERQQIDWKKNAIR